jgi:hypothetical protein
LFPHPGFIDSVTALGNFEWRISIQGATEEAHVATTERPQSFQRIVHGLGELQRRGQLVTANMCVNARSFQSLPHYPELVRRYGVRQLHVDIVRPESTGERNEAYLAEIMPRYSEMAPYYAEMLAGFDRWDPDFDVNVGNLPYCILPAWGSRVHHGGQQTVTKSSDGNGLEDAMNKYEWQTSLRTHLPTCDECVFRSRCTGIFRVYLELHGGDEFKPISREALLALDPERRNFVLLAEPLLAPLRAAVAAHDLPPAWRLRQEVTEDRRRMVEMDFAHAEAESPVKVRFIRPGTARSPVIRTEHYDVEVVANPAVQTAALASLLEWLRMRLAGGLETADLRMAPDAVERAMSESVLLRGRQRVALLAGRLHNGFDLPGWQLEQLRWRPDGSTGEVVARGPAGARVDVCFKVAVRANRSQVSVDFRLADGSDRGSVQPAVDQLVLLLRGPQRAAASSADAAAVAQP